MPRNALLFTTLLFQGGSLASLLKILSFSHLYLIVSVAIIASDYPNQLLWYFSSYIFGLLSSLRVSRWRFQFRFLSSDGIPSKISLIDSSGYSSTLSSILVNVLSQRVSERPIFCQPQRFCPRNVNPCWPAQNYLLGCVVSLLLYQFQCLIASNGLQSIQHLANSHCHTRQIDNSCPGKFLLGNISS